MKGHSLPDTYTAILKGDRLSPEEALNLANQYEWKDLAPWSGQVRQHFRKDKVSLCTIINAKSGSCNMNCSFCSQSAYSSTDAASYPLVPRDVIEKAMGYAEKNQAARCGIVTSGGRLDAKDIRKLGEYIREHKAKYTTGICGSFGRLKPRDLRYLKECGLTRIHHNLESSRTFYPRICTTQTWESRLETVKEALAIGLSVCSGGLFGLGESWQDRIDLALTLRETGIQDIPLNFLIPHGGTPMAEKAVLKAEEALKIIAIYRLILPEATLRICGGRKQVFPGKEKQIFHAGADAIMTGNYLTASGCSPDDDTRMIREAGLSISTGTCPS